jgi:PAS domain S-box-containing protein
MSEVGVVLWLAFALGLVTALLAARAVLGWAEWRLGLPVLALLLISTGPAIEIARHLGVLESDVAHALLDYRWLTVAVIAFAAVLVMRRVVDRERRLHAEVVAAEQRFRSISRVLPVGVFQADVDGRCSYANDFALSMIGIALGDAVGEGWIRRLHPDDRDRVMEEWQAAALEGRDFRSEYRFRKPDGGTLWVLGHVLALKDEDGDVIGHVGAIVDITDRKHSELALEEARATLESRVSERTAELVRANHELAREIESRRRAESALVESESRLRSILENTPARIWIKDLEGRYLYLNAPRAFTEDLGWLHGVVGKTDADFLSAELAAQLRASDRQVIETGAPNESEVTLSGPRGERTYLTVKFPLRDQNDEIYAVAGVATDITMRAKVTEAIRRIYSLSPVIMCTFDLRGYYRAVNPVLPRTLGFTEEEILGHHYLEFVHPGDRDAAVANEALLITGEATVSSFESRNLCKDGSFRILSWDLSSSPKDDAVYGVARDVTEIRRAEQEVAERRDEMAHLMRLQTMGEMASEMAHELNQPLSAIVNYARGAGNRLRSHTASELELLELMEKVAAQALRAGDLIRKMRRFAKRAEIEIEECDLNELVRNAVTLLGAGGKIRVPITLALDQTLPRVHVDGTQIEQVILNLARNGLDAIDGREGGGLRIRTERLGSAEIGLAVTDNGPGLSVQDSEQIFEPFYTTKPSGLGLGLPISRSIVQAHGGRLWAESTPGEGTTFHLALPIDADAAG